MPDVTVLENRGARSLLMARMVPAARTPTMWLNFPLSPTGDVQLWGDGAARDADLAARGAQPRSVTLRVAASSAPSVAASGLTASYSSGVTPVPLP